MTSINDEQRERKLKELRIRWKQQELEGEKAIIHFLREQLTLHEHKSDVLIADLNVMRRDLAISS